MLQLVYVRENGVSLLELRNLLVLSEPRRQQVQQSDVGPRHEQTNRNAQVLYCKALWTSAGSHIKPVNHAATPVTSAHVCRTRVS